MTSPSDAVGPAPSCGDCSGTGLWRGQACEVCLGIGVNPIDWHHHIMWLMTRVDGKQISYDQAHRIVLVREETAKAGFPLRNRYGWAAGNEDVLHLIEILTEEADDHEAAERIGLGSALGEHEFAAGYDLPTDEAYEAGIVAASRPLVEEWKKRDQKKPGARPGSPTTG